MFIKHLVKLSNLHVDCILYCCCCYCLCHICELMYACRGQWPKSDEIKTLKLETYTINGLECCQHCTDYVPVIDVPSIGSFAQRISIYKFITHKICIPINDVNPDIASGVFTINFLSTTKTHYLHFTWSNNRR